LMKTSRAEPAKRFTSYRSSRDRDGRRDRPDAA
jgi:hypothetical protein